MVQLSRLTASRQSLLVSNFDTIRIFPFLKTKYLPLTKGLALLLVQSTCYRRLLAAKAHWAVCLALTRAATVFKNGNALIATGSTKSAA